MDKKELHHLWIKVRRIKPLYFLALCGVCAVVFVVALRDNYSHMVSLRSAVYSADKSDGNIEATLQNLQSYVTHHMNTSLTTTNGVYPPIQLKYTYDRLVQAQSQQLAEESSQNASLYTQAQAYCEAKYPYGYVINKVPCIDGFIQSHGVSVSLSLGTIPASLYEFDFVSPTWSPDLAGWSLVVGVIFLLLFVITYSFQTWIKKRVR